jgi:hypothetical protein
MGQSNASNDASNVLTITLQPLISLGFRPSIETTPFGPVTYPGSLQTYTPATHTSLMSMHMYKH